MPNGTSTSFAQLDSSRSCESTPGAVFARFASGGVAERSWRARPRSSGSDTRPRSCLTSGSVASTVGPSERMPGRAPSREAAHVGERRTQLVERGRRRAQRPRQLADGRRQRALAVGERARGRVEVRDERAQPRRIVVDRGRHDPLVAHPVAEVAGVLAEQRLRHDRRELVGRRLVAQRVVEGLRAAGGLRLGDLGEERAQVVAGVALQRAQHLVELDRRRRARGRDRRALVELLGARRARREVDEEVALEEDPRPDASRWRPRGPAGPCRGSRA